jgi:hypothetical protein
VGVEITRSEQPEMSGSESVGVNQALSFFKERFRMAGDRLAARLGIPAGPRVSDRLVLAFNMKDEGAGRTGEWI